MILLVLLAAALVVAVGLLAVGEGVGKTRQMPDQIVIDSHEAIEFCAQSLPVEVSSILSYDELRRTMRLHLEWLQAYHWAPDGNDDGPIVFEEYDALDYVMERADAVGLEIDRDHAGGVIEAHMSYLQVAGAVHIDDPAAVELDIAEVALLEYDDAPKLDSAGEKSDKTTDVDKPETSD